MKEYLLFDLDGTLTDSGPGITKSVQYALKSFGIDEPDLKKLEGFVGPPVRDSFRRFYGFEGEKAEEAVQKYRERYADVGIFENSPYAGIPEMLKDLKKKGFQLAVASSKPQEYVEKVLSHFGILKYFHVVVGGTMDGKGDKKKDIIEKVLKEFFKDRPAGKEKVYMIGDTSFDIEGAKQAGVESVGVTYGFGKMEDLIEAQADYVVQSVWELWDFLLREVRAKETKEALWRKAPQILLLIAVFLAVKELAYVLFSDIVREVSRGVLSDNTRAAISASAISLAGGAVLPAAKKWIRGGRIDRRLQYLTVQPFAAYVILALTGVMFVWGFNLLFELTGFTAASESYRRAAENWTSVSVPMGILCFGLISPYAEELLFRGVLYNYLRRLLSPALAIILSGLLFGIYHGNPVQGLYAFFMGMFLAYGYEYFGEYKVPLVLHMLFNITALGLGYLNLEREMLPIACAGALLIGVMGFMMLHRRKNVF